MARGINFGALIIRGIKAADRAEQQRQRAVIRAHAAAERAQLQEQRRHDAHQRASEREARAREREAKADERAAARAHIEAQIEEAAELSQGIVEREAEIASLLGRALKRDPAAVLRKERRTFKSKEFDPRPWASTAPNPWDFAVSAPGFFGRLLPGHAKRHAARQQQAERRFDEAWRKHQDCLATLERARAEHDEAQAAERAEVDAHNLAAVQSKAGPDPDDHGAVVAFVGSLVAGNLEGGHDAVGAEIGYSPESRHIVIDLELPDLDAVPEEASFRYVKSADRIEPVLRPAAKRKALYANLLAQVVLKCLDTVFRGVRGGAAGCVTVNGMLDSLNPATGQEDRNCLISVRVTAETFVGLNLRAVQPERCLASLKASVSRSPADLLPVKPIVELNMVDPRFIETAQVLSGLDGRPNLMELSPGEFEGLITNLFEAMGLNSRQTQASRDGGVDCVAFDPRPVFGGKVVIQAKRYKNTVGVSAGRDLFGTMQNEGATKGILVTTSGYGNAAFEFAKGKPLELLDGGNLLHLLKEHASLDARIVMPEGDVEGASGRG
jgi:restriction system protein